MVKNSFVQSTGCKFWYLDAIATYSVILFLFFIRILRSSLRSLTFVREETFVHNSLKLLSARIINVYDYVARN